MFEKLFQGADEAKPVAVAEPTREELFPSAPEPTASDIPPTDADVDVLTQHARLAEKLGVRSDSIARVHRIEFENFLRESGLRAYDRAQVTAYLTSKYGVEKKEDREAFSRRTNILFAKRMVDGVAQQETHVDIPTWGWRPARSVDVPKSDGWWGNAIHGSNGQVQAYVHQYNKPIPIPVLLTMERVTEKFPTVNMYVSDEISAREFVKDPFLMVVHQGTSYIIERWDEPNYKER